MRKTPAILAATSIATIAAATVALPATANAASSPSSASSPRGASNLSAASSLSTATTTAPGTTTPIPTFDYRDCPQIPAGVDPTQWRCEVLVAEGTVTVGDTPLPFDFTAVTHAEGPMPDGTPGQVFGGFRAARLPVPAVPGSQSGGHSHHPKLAVQPHLTSAPDFYSQTGTMSLTFQLTGPALGGHCSIGTTAAPVQVAAARVDGSTQHISQDPPIITFQILDQTLTVPKVGGCGWESGELDRRLGLPSPSGANRLTGTAFYSFKTYDQL